MTQTNNGVQSKYIPVEHKVVLIKFIAPKI